MPEATLVITESDAARLNLERGSQLSTKRSLALYVAGFIAAQFGLLLLVLWITTTPWFLLHDNYPGMYQTGYSLRLKHADCDVLIYGDSSTLTGLDPDIVQNISGLKTCNIAEGGTIQGLVGSSFPLDAYLRNNKPPRFLLTMYTSSIFRPYRMPFEDYQPEGMIYALQYDRGPELYRGLLHRPKWVLNFTIWAGQSMIADFLEHHMPWNHEAAIDTRTQRDSRHGIWPFPFPTETKCTRGALHISPDSIGRYSDNVAAIRNRYGTGKTQMLVNISPVPSCDALQDVYRKQSEGLHDNAFELLPISYFNEGDVHYSSEGSKHISIEAGNQILMLEKQQDTQRQISMTSTARKNR